MKSSLQSTHHARRISDEQGSVLITALIFTLIIAIALTSYLRLSSNSLKLAHRTFFADAANNLAEAGLEEAVWCFNTMGNTTGTTTWTTNGWSVANRLADVYMESMGSGYTSAPTVTISGGGGTGAVGTATITTSQILTNGVLIPITQVTNINLSNVGSGYTSAPTVSLSGGGGTGAVARARLAATRTFTFNNLDQGATGTVKVYVAGCDGSAVVPFVVAQATITPYDGPPIVKIVKVILSKSGVLPKGVVSKLGINWNGHPTANSYLSVSAANISTGPFASYTPATARANTTVASLSGNVDLASGTVAGNVMLGPGVTITGGTITGQTIGNLSYSFAMPTYPTYTPQTGYYSGLNSLPATLPRATDVPSSDGRYYYFVNSATIGATSITAGQKVTIVGTNTAMVGGLKVLSTTSPATVGSCKIYIDGTVSPVNSAINANSDGTSTSWAGALEIYTTTTGTCSISGNGGFYGCLFAPFAALSGNGGGNNAQDLCGSFVVGSITSNGHMSFHYDEALGYINNARPWSLALWTEMQTAAQRATYASELNF